MKMGPRRVLLVSIQILFGILVAALSLWAILGERAREFKELQKNALCILELPAAMSNASASFTTSRTINQFEVGMQIQGKNDRLSLSISRGNGLICRVTTGDRSTRFGCGRDVPPGTYEVTLRRETGSQGARVVVSGEKPSSTTGWQVWSRAYLGGLVLSGVWTFIARKSRNMKRRTASAYLFNHLLLGFVLVFLYLLFHEGGHAIPQMIFGRFDFAQSDFWGIHGTPHSGGKWGLSREPWQQAIISGGGPLLPTFAGWVLFLLFSSRMGRNARSVQPVLNLYALAIIAMLVTPGFIVTPGCLLDIITTDGDWNGLMANVPGPMWLIKGFLWGSVLVSAVVLWRVVPEAFKTWKAQFLEMRKLTH